MATHLQLPDTRLTETRWGVTETTVHDVRRTGGIAGQTSYSVDVTTTTYPHHDEEGETVTDESTIVLYGSTYGTPGPVVLVTAGFGESFVTDPARFGEVFDAAWAYRFAIGREV